MKYRSKVDKNYIIKLIRYDKSYVISVKNKKYFSKYIDIGFTNKLFVSKKAIKESKYIIFAYDEILKERYDIEVY